MRNEVHVFSEFSCLYDKQEGSGNGVEVKVGIDFVGDYTYILINNIFYYYYCFILQNIFTSVNWNEYNQHW